MSEEPKTRKLTGYLAAQIIDRLNRAGSAVQDWRALSVSDRLESAPNAESRVIHGPLLRIPDWFALHWMPAFRDRHRPRRLGMSTLHAHDLRAPRP